MERASRLIGKLKFPGDSVSTEELVCAAWSAAVGKRIAKHARAERLVRTKLIVGVDDAIWGRQLFAMSRMILSKLAESLGEGLVDDLEFRVAPQKRGPAARRTVHLRRVRKMKPTASKIRICGGSISLREKGKRLEDDGKGSSLRGRSGQSALIGRRGPQIRARPGRDPGAHGQAERARHIERGADGAGAVSKPRRRPRCARIASVRRSGTNWRWPMRR